MSGKDTSSYAKKRSRRQTTENSKNIENEKDETKVFAYYLRKYCEANHVFLPQIETYLIKEDRTVIQLEWTKDYTQDNLVRPVISAFCDTNLILKKLICKPPNIGTSLVLALNKTALHFPNLVSLRLDYCDLTCNHIKLIEEDIKCNKTIKELSLRGNPNEEQNFYVLIKCGLKILNLKLCGINQYGLQKIAEEFLKHSPDSTLVHMDLSSNMVFDEGCKLLAKILRCDRTLQSLNLSDCKIRDEGLQDIMKSFLKFSLQDEEIFIRRKLRFEYFKLLKTEKERNSMGKTSIQENEEDALTILEEKLKKHPFTSESTEENGEITCSGNYKLESLNLSYNHLTKPSFDLILKCLMEQSSVCGTDKGLNRLVLDGNPDVQKCEEARNAIEEFLLTKKRRLTTTNENLKSRGSIKRRKSSGGSTLSAGITSKARESVSSRGDQRAAV